MKKLLLLSLSTVTAFSSFAQFNRATKVTIERTAKDFQTVQTIAAPNLSAAAKATGNGDTLLLKSYKSTDTLAPVYVFDQVAPLDSGYVSGMNILGANAFAERLFANGHDSSVQVLGAFIYVYGKTSATSTNSLSVNVWDQGDTVHIAGHPGAYYTGYPSNILATVSVPFASLRKANGRIDSFRYFQFPTPTTPIGKNFFVGASMNYTWSALNGDTVALVTTIDGNRQIEPLTINGTDTAVEVANATQLPTVGWRDNFQQYTGIFNEFIVAAVVKVTYNPASANSVTKNNLTFFGNYPNPATNNTNIKFALKNAADVNVTIMDLNGRVINVINQPKLTAGEHIVSVETANLAAGNYIYMVRTSEGDAMASQMTVIK